MSFSCSFLPFICVYLLTYALTGDNMILNDSFIQVKQLFYFLPFNIVLRKECRQSMIKRELNPEHGKRLSECLNDKKMSQKELAEKSGYTKQYISYIVTGKKNMSSESAEVFANILHIRKEYLLCKDNYKTFDDFFDEISSENEMAKKAALSLLKVHGISISEPFERKLVGKELEDYMAYYKPFGLIPIEPRDILVRVQAYEETPQEFNASEIFEFIERIIEFAEFQAKKIRDKLDEAKPLSEILSPKAPDTN